MNDKQLQKLTASRCRSVLLILLRHHSLLNSGFSLAIISAYSYRELAGGHRKRTKPATKTSRNALRMRDCIFLKFLEATPLLRIFRTSSNKNGCLVLVPELALPHHWCFVSSSRQFELPSQVFVGELAALTSLLVSRYACATAPNVNRAKETP